MPRSSEGIKRTSGRRAPTRILKDREGRSALPDEILPEETERVRRVSRLRGSETILEDRDERSALPDEILPEETERVKRTSRFRGSGISPVEKKGPRRRAPAMTLEDREDQLILLAVNLAEKKLIDGTAPNSIINHYLALGSSKAKLEREKLAKENALLGAKTDQIKSEEASAEQYREVIRALTRYRGIDDGDD